MTIYLILLKTVLAVGLEADAIKAVDSGGKAWLLSCDVSCSQRNITWVNAVNTNLGSNYSSGEPAPIFNGCALREVEAFNTSPERHIGVKEGR